MTDDHRVNQSTINLLAKYLRRDGIDIAWVWASELNPHANGVHAHPFSRGDVPNVSTLNARAAQVGIDVCRLGADYQSAKIEPKSQTLHYAEYFQGGSVKSVQRRIRDDAITIVFMSAILGAFAWHFSYGWLTFLLIVTVYVVVRGLLTVWWIRHPKPPQPVTRYTR